MDTHLVMIPSNFGKDSNKNPKNEKGSGGKRDKEWDMLHKTNDILNANFV